MPTPAAPAPAALASEGNIWRQWQLIPRPGARKHTLLSPNDNPHGWDFYSSEFHQVFTFLVGFLSTLQSLCLWSDCLPTGTHLASTWGEVVVAFKDCSFLYCFPLIPGSTSISWLLPQPSPTNPTNESEGSLMKIAASSSLLPTQGS